MKCQPSDHYFMSSDPSEKCVKCRTRLSEVWGEGAPLDGSVESKFNSPDEQTESAKRIKEFLDENRLRVRGETKKIFQDLEKLLKNYRRPPIGIRILSNLAAAALYLLVIAGALAAIKLAVGFVFGILV